MFNDAAIDKKDDKSEAIYRQIYDFIWSSEYIPCKRDELMYILGFSDLQNEFDVALDNLIRAGVVVVGKRGRIISAESSNQVFGTFKAISNGSGFVFPDMKNSQKAQEKIFISQDFTLGAVSGDRVSAVILKPIEKNLRKSACGKITKILEKNKRIINGVVCLQKQYNKRKNVSDVELCVRPYDKHFPFLICLNRDDHVVSSDVGDIVSVQILSDPKQGIATGSVIENFGSCETIVPVYNAILREYGISTDINGGFSEEQSEEARKLSLKNVTNEDIKTRVDLRSKSIFTLDGEDARDLDDAISVEKNVDGWILGVHIADVSHYVCDSSTLDIEAFNRGMSVYFPDRVVPMLPATLSNGICSLNADEDRLALSAFMKIDKNGNIVSSEFHESVIRSKLRGVYSEINDYIENGSGSPFFSKYNQLGETIELIVELYYVLERKSAERGALSLETSEAEILLDEENNPCSVRQHKRGIGERIIEQFMLCANEAVASMLFWSNLPCIYRIHDEPSPLKIKQFTTLAHNLGLDTSRLRAKKIYSSALQSILGQAEEKEVKNIVSYVMLRSLMKARYSSSASKHFGLAIEKYCHFTSPIRRYPDLAVHRIVKAMLHGKIDSDNCSVWEKSAKIIAEKSSENELRTVEAEMRIDDLFKAKYMSCHIDETFEGIISSVTSFGFFVELENTCDGLVSVSSLDGFYSYDEKSLTLTCREKVYHLGQSVKVKVNSVDLLAGKTEFKVI